MGLLPALRADVRQRLARHRGRAVRGRDQGDQGGSRGQGRHRTRVDALKELTAKFKELYEFPQDPQEQLRQAIRAVFDSWTGQRAVSYRRLNRIPDDWAQRSTCSRWSSGTRARRRASGVAFSRDEVTGAPEPSGDFLINAQGEDVVSGVRNTLDIAEMADRLPEAHEQLMEILRHARGALQGHAGHRVHRRGGAAVHAPDPQRRAPAQAAVRFAVDAVSEELLTREEAVAGDDRPLDAGRAPAPDVRSGGRLRGARHRRQRPRRRARRRARSCSDRGGGRRGGGGGARRDPRAPVHRGRRRRGLQRRARGS